MAATPIANRPNPGTAANANGASGWPGPNSAVRRSWRRPEGWIVSALAEPEGHFQHTTLLLHKWREVTGLTVRAPPSLVIDALLIRLVATVTLTLVTVVCRMTRLVLGTMTGLLPTAILTL